MSGVQSGKVGAISEKVIELLDLSIDSGTPIYIGDTNITHMQSKHHDDFDKYGNNIPDIINNPDYVGLNSKDNSIEYVKEFEIDNNFVKVAVRVSTSGTFFARSIYALNSNRVQNFIDKGTLIKY